MKIYLVINKSTEKPLPYSKQYHTFTNINNALEYAKNLGFKDELDVCIRDTIGMITTYKAGNVDVAILPLELNDPITIEKKKTRPPSNEELEEMGFEECPQCEEIAWDGRICQVCGLKNI